MPMTFFVIVNKFMLIYAKVINIHSYYNTDRSKVHMLLCILHLSCLKMTALQI